MSLKLYGYWRSSAAFRVRIALNLKGLAFESIPTHLLRDGGQQHSPAYRALNPQGLVPALVDDDFVVGQSLAICEYLEETRPEPALLPRDARGRAVVRAMALGIACDVHPLNNLRVLNYLRQEYTQDDAGLTRWMHTWMSRGFAALETLIERHSGDGRHCHGDAVTLADVFLLPQVYNGRRYELDFAPYPRLTAVAKHLDALPAFIAARPDAQVDAQ